MALVEIPVVLGVEIPDNCEDCDKDAERAVKEILERADERLVFARAQFAKLVVSRD